MKAAVLERTRQLVVKDVPDPVATGAMAVVRVKACGICLTDYKAYTGERTNVTFPSINGHEFAGVVESVGPGVRFVQPGDEVIASPVACCGTCKQCRSGKAHYCTRGACIGGDGMDTLLDGAFAEKVLVPELALYQKPSTTSFEAAALTEPLGDAWKGLIEYSQLRVGEDLVIIGAGSMGLLAMMIAARAGAASIIAIDVNDWRLDFAKKCGATHVINSATTSAIDAVKAILPEGPDLVFETAGPPAAAQLAFDLCRRGTRVNEFGVTTTGTITISPAQVHWKETRVDASFSLHPGAMLQAIRLQERGIVDAAKIITHRFPLDRAPEAMSTMTAPDRVKIVILP